MKYDYDYFELPIGQDAYAYFCNVCHRHYQWKEEHVKCLDKHRQEARSRLVLTGDDD